MSLLSDLSFGWRCISARPGLVGLLAFFAVVNFLWGMVGALVKPMILSWTSSDALGAIISIAGLGMLAGSVIMSVWAGPQRRGDGHGAQPDDRYADAAPEHTLVGLPGASLQMSDTLTLGPGETVAIPVQLDAGLGGAPAPGTLPGDAGRVQILVYAEPDRVVGGFWIAVWEKSYPAFLPVVGRRGP